MNNARKAFMSTVFYLISLFLSTTIAQNPTENYCNLRFDFCVEYPSELFTFQERSVNNDGIKMWTNSRDITVELSGTHNVFSSSIEEEYELFKAAVEESDGKIDETLMISGDDYFEVTFYVGDKVIYQKTMLQNNHFVNLTIQTNLIVAMHHLDILKDQIQFSENS